MSGRGSCPPAVISDGWSAMDSIGVLKSDLIPRPRVKDPCHLLRIRSLQPTGGVTAIPEEPV
jgi:hypothetical protein